MFESGGLSAWLVEVLGLDGLPVLVGLTWFLGFLGSLGNTVSARVLRLVGLTWT